jgi:hypothetical protein
MGVLLPAGVRPSWLWTDVGRDLDFEVEPIGRLLAREVVFFLVPRLSRGPLAELGLGLTRLCNLKSDDGFSMDGLLSRGCKRASTKVCMKI